VARNGAADRRRRGPALRHDELGAEHVHRRPGYPRRHPARHVEAEVEREAVAPDGAAAGAELGVDVPAGLPAGDVHGAGRRRGELQHAVAGAARLECAGVAGRLELHRHEVRPSGRGDGDPHLARVIASRERRHVDVGAPPQDEDGREGRGMHGAIVHRHRRVVSSSRPPGSNSGTGGGRVGSPIPPRVVG